MFSTFFLYDVVYCFTDKKKRACQADSALVTAFENVYNKLYSIKNAKER